MTYVIQRELEELIASTPDGTPLFASLDEACAAFGFDAAPKARIRREMELTAPRDPGETLQ